jgi:hypothetical protein
VGAQDHRDPGGVDEGAALEADQHAAALGDSGGQDLVKLTRDCEVELPFDLYIPAARPQISLGDVETLYHDSSRSVRDRPRPRASEASSRS